MFCLFGGQRKEHGRQYPPFFPFLFPVWFYLFQSSLLPLKDGQMQHQAEQSYFSAPMTSSILLVSIVLHIVIVLYPHNRHHSFFVFLFLIFCYFFRNNLPSSVIFFRLLEQLGAEKVFFGFDLSINRKSLKCPFLF